MGQTAESNRFYQEREKVAIEFISGYQSIRSAVGARGFTIMPGYLDEAVTDLEFKIKRDLSVANLAILTEAIERELKQTGHDYDIAVKSARIEWEVEKQTLLAALAAELVDYKKKQALTEDEIDRRSIELGIRESLLIVAKTEIGFEVEALKRELLQTERLTWNKELELLNARTITAQSKLAVIPILEQIIAEEAKVLAQEELNVDYAQELANARQLLIDKKYELIPHMITRAEKQLEVAAAILEEIEVRKDRLGVSLQKALTARDRTDAQVALTEADAEIEGLRLILVAARNNLQEIDDLNRLALQGMRVADVNALAAAESGLNAEILGYEEEAASRVRDIRKQISELDTGTDVEANRITVDAETDAMKWIAFYLRNERKETAKIAAMANITSKLTHLLLG